MSWDTLYILYCVCGSKKHLPVDPAVYGVRNDGDDRDRHTGAGREHAYGHHDEFDYGGDQHNGRGSDDDRS